MLLSQLLGQGAWMVLRSELLEWITALFTMMTSNTQTGKATEAVMAKVHLHAPELTTAQYNAIYEDVAKELEFRLAKKGDAIVRPQGGGIMF